MSVIEWNKPEDKTYESGLDRGVFFLDNLNGVPWNGLVNVDRETVGGEVEALYFDGQKYLDFVSGEDFRATLTALSTPAGFAECEGRREIAAGLFVSHQRRKTFGFSYRSGLGNELEGEDFGYKLHLVYNATATPGSISHRTRSNDVELSERSWVIDTVPVEATTHKPTAHLEISTATADPLVIAQIEEIIYGTPATLPRLPTQAEVISIFQAS